MDTTISTRRPLAARLRGPLSVLVLAAAVSAAPDEVRAAAECNRTVTANVVALDNPIFFNRLGAQNVNWMMYALERDVVDSSGTPLSEGGARTPGMVFLRADKRPRPIVLRVAKDDCLQVNFTNLLAPAANPNNGDGAVANEAGVVFNGPVNNNQVAGRFAGFHVQGMELVNSIADDASFVGANASSLVASGDSATYTLRAAEEGSYLVTSYGATFGGEASGGNVGMGLFGQVNVEPPGARIYRSQVTEEELRLATTAVSGDGFPVIDYEATYPDMQPFIDEGKAGLPILNMMTPGDEIVHSDINAIVAGPNADGTFPPSTYPLESVGMRNPTYPTRLQPFREFASIWHDENAASQAFPAWFNDPVLSHTLHGVRDSFMINYGSGGIGAEIIANRLGVGPMYDCLGCAYEEFFLTSFTVGDPAQLVDIPANLGLEACDPALNNCLEVGPKANFGLYPADPANVHHSYTGDKVKFRNVHAGPKEQHIFHLHNHQWLFNPNDDNSNYLDAQGIGPGSSYTYEIAFGGSGNRNKTAGDAIFHCHFYPHFAQGMWYMWRVHDTLETGTRLAVSDAGLDGDGIHDNAFELFNGTPANNAGIVDLADPTGPALNPATFETSTRALPDGEVVVGMPTPAVVPLPGKPMAPVPGKVVVVAKDSNADGIADSSQAKVVDRDVNPGYPFWIGGIEDIVGQRPPTPPLDMKVNAADPTSGGWDGGLPRHSIDGYLAGGASMNTQTRLDMSKLITTAKPVWFPEDGTQVEKAAMAFHAQRCHDTALPDGTPAVCDTDPLTLNDSGQSTQGGFITNGAPTVPGAPFQEPCIDDEGDLLATGVTGNFFDGQGGLGIEGASQFTADAPRLYKAAVIQTDVTFNKVGYHFPQQRIITLWEDVEPTLTKMRPPEPFVLRLNTFDCANFLHTNLVPKEYELDDYQVRTPTDIIGQHIHLPKWDLTTADGAANGWNYEDGTLSPGMVLERIEAINAFNAANPPVLTDVEGNSVYNSAGEQIGAKLYPLQHPFFKDGGPIYHGKSMWLGARTTIQRWFADPVVNAEGVDRGLGVIFTHDHYGPSTHQQVGLYATVLIEPAGSYWVHNETGDLLYDTYKRNDGGPTSWQAAILTGDPDGDGYEDSFREFYFEFSDFQHAYEKGVFAGVAEGSDRTGEQFVVVPPGPDTFLNSINPSFRQEASPLLPDVGFHPPFCPGGVPRPCPEAISADDPGMLVVNYRNEPLGLRVFDPDLTGPDGRPGTQAAGDAGDLALALQSRKDRAIPQMNTVLGDTPYGALNNDLGQGDPFTPMIRAQAGDLVRVKIQSGATEHEHSASVQQMKWLQSGSGFGQAPNSGWRNAQNDGISEQFTFTAPVVDVVGQAGGSLDRFYSVDMSHDGWWSGMWGLMRTYGQRRNDLFEMPNGMQGNFNISNAGDFRGVCPAAAPVRSYDITAVLANDVLGNPLGLAIPSNAGQDSDGDGIGDNEGGPLDPAGGTLVYNPRDTELVLPANPELGTPETVVGSGGLHDPTAVMYVYTDDLLVDPSNPGCYEEKEKDGVITTEFNQNLDSCPVTLRPGAPVEPVVLRAAAGECIEVTVNNRLPEVMPDLAGFNTLLQVVNRDRDPIQGLTWFHNNLVRPSSKVGLQPQLVASDASRVGPLVGDNPEGLPLVDPGRDKTFRLYAGDINFMPEQRNNGQAANRRNVLVATPIEFGGSNLLPADKIKQGQKGLTGALVIEPAGSTWTTAGETQADRQSGVGVRETRAAATVTGPGGTFREGVVMIKKGQNHRFADGSPVQNIAGEGGAVPEDSHDAGQMSINYGTEPMWFRFGLAPQTPFGNAGQGLGAVPNPELAYSNSLLATEALPSGQDPVTPVFTATAGQEFRMRVLSATGAGRGTTFDLNGHVWQRDPYVCPGSADLGLAGKCDPDEVGSQAIGTNAIGMYLGGQESVTPAQHFEILLRSAGGANAVSGDYLFRDHASFGNTSGLWGILRVQ